MPVSLREGFNNVKRARSTWSYNNPLQVLSLDL
jgi:hypothetical protein